MVEDHDCLLWNAVSKGKGEERRAVAELLQEDI